MINLELEFYQNLGKLFYSIAASDKIIRKSEIDVLRDLIQSKWLPLDDYEDEFHEDAAFQIETVFDWLESEKIKADICFNDFKLFKKENEKLFNDKRKQLIWLTSNAIANAFSGKNKSEVIVLAKLKMLLE